MNNKRLQDSRQELQYLEGKMVLRKGNPHYPFKGLITSVVGGDWSIQKQRTDSYFVKEKNGLKN